MWTILTVVTATSPQGPTEDRDACDPRQIHPELTLEADFRTYSTYQKVSCRQAATGKFGQLKGFFLCIQGQLMEHVAKDTAKFAKWAPFDESHCIFTGGIFPEHPDEVSLPTWKVQEGDCTAWCRDSSVAVWDNVVCSTGRAEDCDAITKPQIAPRTCERSQCPKTLCPAPNVIYSARITVKNKKTGRVTVNCLSDHKNGTLQGAVRGRFFCRRGLLKKQRRMLKKKGRGHFVSFGNRKIHKVCDEVVVMY